MIFTKFACSVTNVSVRYTQQLPWDVVSHKSTGFDHRSLATRSCWLRHWLQQYSTNQCRRHNDQFSSSHSCHVTSKCH